MKFDRASARSAYFSGLLGYLSDRDSGRLAQAMTLLSSQERESLNRFHVDGVKDDREGESSAADALVKALHLVSS